MKKKRDFEKCLRLEGGNTSEKDNHSDENSKGALNKKTTHWPLNQKLPPIAPFGIKMLSKTVSLNHGDLSSPGFHANNYLCGFSAKSR